jgi:glycerol-1-phosphate dehydrogenase [NAD(P)+]
LGANVVYGKLDGLGETFGRFAVMTMDVPWGLVKDRIGGKPAKVVMTEGLENDYLDMLVQELPQVDTVVGIGGGVAIDTAKYFAWKRGCKAVFIPTIVSVNAYATPGAAVRFSGKVNYLGNVIPERIVIDYLAIQSAPKRLNTAGTGDIYSCRTALFDWWLAHEKKGELYDEKIAGESRRILSTLVSNAGEIKNVTEKGIKTLVQLHIDTNTVQLAAKSPRPEEGSEHLFFYTLEELTGRTFVHGEVVGTGIYILTHFQNNEEAVVEREMDAMGLLFRPKEYGITHDEFVNTVLQMKRYSEEAKSMFTIVNVVDITRDDAEMLWKRLT